MYVETTCSDAIYENNNKYMYILNLDKQISIGALLLINKFH